MGVKTDKHIAGFADGQILGKVAGWPGRDDFRWRRSPISAVMARKMFRCVRNHCALLLGVCTHARKTPVPLGFPACHSGGCVVERDKGWFVITP